MKKIILLLTALLSLTLLASCSGGGNSLKDIRSRGKLVMATNATFPPYEYYDGSEITGFDVELAQAIADKIGVPLVIEDMEFNSVVLSVSSGKADVAIAGLTITEERKQNIDFSDSYIKATQVIIVEEGSGVHNTEDLGVGKRVGVQIATTGAIYAEDELEAEVSQYNTGVDAVMDLKNGNLDAVIIDDQPAKKFVEANDGIVILDEPFVDEFYAVGVKKGSTELTKTINEVIQELKNSGEYDRLIEKYIG